MPSCFLCEQEGENPICNKNDGSITYFCDFHYALAMGKDIGMLDRLKHTFRHRGGSMRGEPSEISHTNKIMMVFVLSLFVLMSAILFLRMYIVMPFETSIGLAHMCSYSGFMIVVCTGLGWKVYWKEWFKQYDFAKLIFVLSIIGGFFMFLIPIGLYWNFVVEWFEKVVLVT